MGLSPYSFRVYQAHLSVLGEPMTEQVGKWVVHVSGYLPRGMQYIALCVVDDFGDLVVVR